MTFKYKIDDTFSGRFKQGRQVVPSTFYNKTINGIMIFTSPKLQ